MDLEEILLRLRSLSSVKAADLEAIAEIVAEKNKTISKLKTLQIEREKEGKRQEHLTKVFSKIKEAGDYDTDAFRAFVDSGLIPFDKLNFSSEGALQVGDRALPDFLDSIPYIKKGLLCDTNQDPKPDPKPDPKTDSGKPVMGTSRATDGTTDPLDALVKEGLFAVPALKI